ncbi:OmpP1/FadL family transporter [Microbulbifer elongatus]|uniref:Outer membrane protein transport protein n=1 Tax=Microbulbifer elongatus TaxID=86173 RepID=A0ABT1NYL9_9GAMM|nr:outer membrane protein transport protein [Microbulbifer elongatus]MCQ3827881.1 outer membrane protein transport protein [Microbulbifer elongatus]
MTIKTLRRAALAAAICSASSGAMAAGFALQESSVSGLGRAYAAENTIGDNAAILARNPAGSALFDRITITGGFNYVDPEIDAAGYTQFFAQTPNGEFPLTEPLYQEANDYATDAIVPFGYVAVPIDDCWSFGFAMNADYGLETDFDSNWLVTHISDKTELLTVNLAPSVAYNYRDVFSVGVSVNFLYADATLNTKVPNDFPVDPSLSNAKILNASGDDWDTSWAIGALWNITDRTRVGISYQAEFDPKLDADVDSDLLPSVINGLPFDNEPADLTLDLPDVAEIGLYHRFNKEWGLAVGATWTDWDDFERLEAFFPDQTVGGEPYLPYNPLHIKEENFKTGWRYSVGLEYYPCEEVTWRMGYAYDEGAARDGLYTEESELVGRDITWRTLSIPDNDRQWVTFGGTYKFNNQLSIDGGLAYIWGDDAPIQEFSSLPVAALGGALNTYFDGGTTNLEAWIAGVGLNYSF